MKSTRVLIRAKGRGLCIERGLYDCLQKELFADVTLKCEGGKIRANKGVLAAASPVLCHLLKDWPLTEDPCVIMAGYTEEEVQGLVRYIYTGQLSAPQLRGSSWEKIIGDFKVGSQLENDDDLASIHELTDYGESSPLHEPEPNGMCHLQQSHLHAYRNVHIKSPIKGVGPKIVAVTSPRPLIVQVQSLTQAQTINQGLDLSNDVNDIPSEMTVEDDNREFVSDNLRFSDIPTVVVKRKRGGRILKRLQRVRGPVQETNVSSDVNVPGILKKLPSKKSKATSKFSRKKYVCPHCNRRFLTRGNVKNHMRIHSRDKPFQCPVCSDLFAYHAVYQRHLLRHKEKNEIGENEYGNEISDSLRLANEIGKRDGKSVRVIDDEEPETERELEGESNELENEIPPDETDKVMENENAEEEEPVEEEELAEEEGELVNEEELIDDDDDEHAELNPEEEENIALKLQNKTKLTASSKNNVCPDEKVSSNANIDDGEKKKNFAEANEIEEGKGKARRIEIASTSIVKNKQNVAGKNIKAQMKPRNHYQVIQCDFCPMKYHAWSAFYFHRCTHTGEIPVIPCSICNMEFANIRALKEHKTMEHPESLFQCEECDRSFLSKNALHAHESVHSTSLNYQCRHCSEKMGTRKECYLHEQTHMTEEITYQCTHCRQQFNALANLRAHLKVHSKEPDSHPA